MTRTLFGLILLANLAFFAFIRWGSLLTQSDIDVPQPSLNADKIKLLGFTAAAIPASAVAASAPPPVQNPLPASQQTKLDFAEPVCLEWGEFSGADLTNATADLATLKLGDKLSQREAEHAIGYWVYIPPLKSHSAVKTKVAQLKKLGIKEYFIVQEKGKWQNTISLGVFKAKHVAQRYLDSLKKRGVRSAVMGERQTRLKFTVFVLRDPDAATLSKLAEWQKDFTDIGMSAASCK